MMTNHLLIQARKRAGLSQKQVAEQLHVAKSTVHRWEHGEVVPYPCHIQMLCQLYQKTARELGLSCASAGEPNDLHPALFDAGIPMLPKTSLIGRNRELAHLKARLFRENAGTLNMLTGLPGVGKTALAITLAHDAEVHAHFKDGLLWAGLGPTPDVSKTLHRWGMLLGLSHDELQTLSNPESWALALHEAIGSREMLIVLDDVWMLEDALKLKVGGHQCAYLLTTRFPGLAKQSRSVMPLPELTSRESLTLLRRLAPYVVEHHEEQARTLIQRVGGLPLALQLLGNYLHQHASTGQPRRLQAALQRLTETEARLSLSEPQSPLERHPSLPGEIPLSLHTILAVSFQVLAEPVQAALCALSLLPAKPETFSESSALAVAACSEETLDSLVDAGLVELSGASRYTLHQTIADEARSRLTPADAQTGEARLIAYVMEYLETHQHDYRLLDRELATIWIALERVSQSEQHEVLLHIVRWLAPCLIHKGLYQKIEPYLHQAYEIARTQHYAGSEAQVAHYLEQFAQVLFKLGQYERAKTYLQEGLLLARQVGQAEQMSLLLKGLGAIADIEGDYPRAQEYLLEGLSLARSLHKSDLIVPNLINLGGLYLSLEDYALASDYLQEALELAQQIGRPAWIIFALSNLYIATTKLGLLAQSQALVEEGMKISSETGHVEGMMMMFSRRGELQDLQGGHTQACANHQKALALAQQMGDPYSLFYALIASGRNAEWRGHYAQAKAYFLEALQLSQQVSGHQWCVSQVYGCLSRLALKQGHYQEAMDFCHTGLLLQEPVQLDTYASLSLLHSYQALGYLLQHGTLTEELEAGLHQARELLSVQHQWETRIKVFGIHGEIAMRQGHYEQAMQYLEEAWALASQFHSTSEGSWLFALLGETAIKQEQYQQAACFLRKGQKLAASQSCPEYQGRVLLALGELALQQGQLETAQTTLQQSQAILPEANSPLQARANDLATRIAAA